MKSKVNSMFSRSKKSHAGNEGTKNAGEWEVRPGGMVVQKRNSDVDQSLDSASTINVRVKYGPSYHQIRINSQASFGELKKMLEQPTGLHHQDQKLLYKKKERDSKEYLDLAGVKYGSKITLVEDVVSRERRSLEMLKNANKAKAAKSLSVISLEVDKLAQQVAAMEGTASKGGNIAVTDIENLTDALMTTLIKLDEVVAEGDLKLQRRMQVKRVQKQIEALDFLKLQQSMRDVSLQRQEHSSKQKHILTQKQAVVEPRHNKTTMQKRPVLDETKRHADSVVVTSKWETFD